jgi:hypothetical protein
MAPHLPQRPRCSGLLSVGASRGRDAVFIGPSLRSGAVTRSAYLMDAFCVELMKVTPIAFAARWFMLSPR